VATLRTPEQLKMYRFGRYVDPGDPLVMHESHPVYRVETSAGWNLTPGKTAAPPVPLPATVSTATAHDAVIAEINKQQAATRAFADEMVKVDQRLAELSKTVANMPDLTEQNLAFQREIMTIRDHLDTLDNHVRESRPSAPISIPTADKW
jgi:hypothetical protein